ncbi:hypothetical protein, partial [Escherichia coli]|uniref:hypothetical protein n=1 Tax=Escherichia coli TaxID=562 RepID=UPI001BFD7A89
MGQLLPRAHLPDVPAPGKRECGTKTFGTLLRCSAMAASLLQCMSERAEIMPILPQSIPGSA